MGTIVLDQLLREAVQQRVDLPVRNIVYMAAAASVREVQDSVLPHLRAAPGARFYNLMLHPVAEERESYTWGGVPIDPGPRGSLLVLIDNFLSKPLTYLDRTAGRYDNFMPAAHAVPEDLRPRVSIKAFSVGDSPDVRGASPQKHGEFTTRFRWWIEGCWKPEPAMRSVTPRDCLYDR